MGDPGARVQRFVFVRRSRASSGDGHPGGCRWQPRLVRAARLRRPITD
jgi:hypothetical protein